MSFIYLATPYSHPLESVRKSRYEAAMDAVHLISQHQIPVYSPIVHWHIVGARFQLPGDHEFWSVQDRGMMQGCREAWVLAISGWHESKGIKAEIEFLRRLEKQVAVLNFESLAAACRMMRSFEDVSVQSLQNPQPILREDRPVPGVREGQATAAEGQKEARSGESPAGSVL